MVTEANNPTMVSISQMTSFRYNLGCNVKKLIIPLENFKTRNG